MLVSIDEAMAYTGHKTKAGLRGFIVRLNKKLPLEKRVIRLNGRFDLESLREAVAYYSREVKSVTRPPRKPKAS